MQRDYSDPEYLAFRLWMLEYEAFRFVQGYEPNAEQRELLAGMQREAWDIGEMPWGKLMDSRPPDPSE